MLFWEDMITLISMLEVLLFLLSIWTFILNHLDLNIHATIKKTTLWIMLGTIPHQKFSFYHLPTRGRAGIKLGDAWYVSNVSIIFYCSMLLYYPFWMFMGFILHIYIIFGTNLLTGGPARIAVFLPISVFQRKGISNGTKPSGAWFLERTWSRGLGVQVKKRSRRPRDRRARPPPLGAPLSPGLLEGLLTWSPSLQDDILPKNHDAKGFIPFGLRLIFLFFEILNRAIKQQYGLGLRLIG